jgi:hypothetical protein
MNFYTLTRKHDLFRNYKPSTRWTDYCPKKSDDHETECRGEDVFNKTGGLKWDSSIITNPPANHRECATSKDSMAVSESLEYKTCNAIGGQLLSDFFGGIK